MYKHVYVIDLSGLSLRMLKGGNRALIQACLGRVRSRPPADPPAGPVQHPRRRPEQVSQYYPETLLKMFIVNAPRLFPAVWSGIKPMIDPVSAAKISILGHLSNDPNQPARQELLGAGVDQSFLETLIRTGARTTEA